MGKVFGRVLDNRVKEGTDWAIGDEQCGFREGRGCVDQLFVVRQVCVRLVGVD